jgi:hypothetical protein
MTINTQRPGKLRVFQRRDIDSLPRLAALPASERQMMKVVSAVLPFRVNNYVVDELIDWDRVPDDPMYRLTFPHRDMLGAADYETMERLVSQGASDEVIEAAAREIQRSLNPHPAGQVEYNVPLLDGLPVAGIQHKYRETVLFFPTQGQTCHAEAYSRVSGLARTVRGPSMSAMPGKIIIDGTPEIFGVKVFALRFLQARDLSWVGKPFFARFDPHVTWFDKLRPAFGDSSFFFDASMERMKQSRQTSESSRRQLPVLDGN